MRLMHKNYRLKSTLPKDRWEKFDIIIRGASVVLISGAITFYGIYSEQKQFITAERNRKSQILVETMNNREASAADMRAQMFKTLMEHYFKNGNGSGKHDNKTQVSILELIGLNFQDHIYLKPLFENLDSELEGEGDHKARDMLRRASKNIVRNEVSKIKGSNGEVFNADLSVTSSVTFKSVVTLTLLKVEEDHIVVSSDRKDSDGFIVTYFDTPFMDNTRLNELTYSVLLLKTDKKNQTAKIKVVFFPENFYSPSDNLHFDRLIGEYLKEDVR